MQVDFYSLIEGLEDKSIDLRQNLVSLFDNLLQKGGLQPELSMKIAQLRARIEIELGQLS